MLVVLLLVLFLRSPALQMANEGKPSGFVLFFLIPSLSLFRPLFCWVLCYFLFLSVPVWYLSVAHAGMSLIYHFIWIVLPMASSKQVQRCCIQSLGFASFPISEAFFFTAEMALCIGYAYMRHAKLTERFSGALSIRGTFMNLAKTLMQMRPVTGRCIRSRSIEQQQINIDNVRLVCLVC